LSAGWLDMFGERAAPPKKARAGSRLINRPSAASGEGATAVRSAGDRCRCKDGVRAAEVLKEAHSQGFKGAMIGTQPKGKGGVLDRSLVAAAVLGDGKTALGSIVLIHPVFESGDDRVHDYGMANAGSAVSPIH